MNSVTEKVLGIFTEISNVPRCSKNEEKIGKWLQNWAAERDLEYKTDKAGNVLIKVPGKNGLEKSQPIALQGHMDMVCEKTPDSTHDFSKDPIKLMEIDGWLTADKTTLGADNGIALAISLALADSQDIKHPPLELLFTVDEETGLTGANFIEPGFIDSKILLNIDSEDEGVLTIGCAGGRDTKIELPLNYIDANSFVSNFKISLTGLKGGHSGVDIIKNRANAIKIMARLLNRINNKFGLNIIDFNGGSAHNAIPRYCVCDVAIEENDLVELENELAEFQKIVSNEFKNEDKINFKIEKIDFVEKIIDSVSSEKMIDLLIALPNGIFSMSEEIENLVETSNNEATANIIDGKLHILSSQRSSVVSKLDNLTNKIEAVCRLANADYESGNGYPAWEPNWDSKLLAKCKQTYFDLFKKEPVVEVIHAGLECGIIGSKFENMDMISIGPTIENPHSPDERMKISDIEKIWNFLIGLFQTL